jgi:fatty acyl-CoA reductase
MEKPLCLGDCIARENPIVSGSTALDIENDVKLALNSKEDFQENKVAQKMKDLGLER